MEAIQRIHHISATVGDPNENLFFYRAVLKLRLVKQTVNFEDNGTYHLYFANQEADAGSVITFFPRLDDLKGRVGAGQVRRIAFSVPKGTLNGWKAHLDQYSIAYRNETMLNRSALFFNDPHQLHLALVESDETRTDSNIIGFHGVELLSENPDETFQFLVQEMGLLLNKVDSSYYYLEMIGEEGHQVLVNRTLTKRGRLGIGTVHHIAWEIPDKGLLAEWKETIEKERNVTDIHNRKYFQSAYFRDPGHIIYELATAGPGFTVDEPLDKLGTSLMLPEQYEKDREVIEARLPKLDL